MTPVSLGVIKASFTESAKYLVILKRFCKLAEGYGKNIVEYSGPHIFLVTSDPVIIKDILSSKLCVSKPDLVYDGLTNAWGKGLITLQGTQWAHQRRILNGSFKNANLQAFVPVFNKKLDIMFKNIDDDIAKGQNTSLLHYMREMTLRISFETVIGRDLDKTEYDVKHMAEIVSKTLEFSGDFTSNFIYLVGIVRVIAKMTKYKIAASLIVEFNNIILKSMENYKRLQGIDPSYIENSEYTALENVVTAIQRNETVKEDTLGPLLHVFLGAFETSSSTLYYIILLLATHPDVQQQAYEEVCNIFPEDDEGIFEVTYEQLGHLKYIEMVANEAMRIWPIIPQVGRKVVGGNLKLSNGVVLPEGLRIMIDIYNVHRSKEIWGPDAHKFNPDNFQRCNVEARHPYAFIPFTKGIRTCIGMKYSIINIKIALAKLLKRYRFSTRAKMEDFVFENHIVLQLMQHPNIKIEKRKMSENR
ncbi:probable cytochrome P450 313a4 [Stomoxys calcitrans]|uniref:probable cytochrome P450 313a4 n=1 Tax=Stomoxys calcitrans TaxID=35570 RepID=UPI0027E3AD0F|nr:probable cytochrome P450 313a4 [Stomoxys calcitrans]